MWHRIVQWLQSEGALPNDNELRDDLIGPEYSFSAKEQIQLERKADMKKRGLASPDAGDALAISFFTNVMTNEDRSLLRRKKKMREESRKHDPHARFREKSSSDPHKRFRSRAVQVH